MDLQEYLEREAKREQLEMADKEKVAEAMSGRPHSVLTLLMDGLEKRAADITQASRERLSAGSFALKKKEIGKSKAEPAPGEAKGKYPIHDLPHARNALARAKQQLNAGNLTKSAYDGIVARVYAKYPELKKGREERGEKPLGKQAAPKELTLDPVVAPGVSPELTVPIDATKPQRRRSRVTRGFKHPGWGKGYKPAPSTPAGRAEIFQRKMDRMLGYSGPGPKDQPVAKARPVRELSRRAFGPSMAGALARKTPQLRRTQKATDAALLGMGGRAAARELTGGLKPPSAATPIKEMSRKAFGDEKPPKTSSVREKLAEAAAHGRAMAQRDYRRMLALTDPEQAVRRLYQDEGTTDMVKTAAFQQEVLILRTIGERSGQ